MVKGIEKFREYFSGFEDNYIIIGGTACDILEEKAGQPPRATKDIDIILVVEALTPAFVKRFWKFVKEGEFQSREKGNGKHEYFRFLKPGKDEFPSQIEIFSKVPDMIKVPEDAVLTPVPVDEDLSSLSAILMNEEYYDFTLAHSDIEDKVHIANIESLIVLKAKAFNDLSNRKASGEKIDSKNITKHKNDVFRLVTMLGEADNYSLSPDIFLDLTVFCKAIHGSMPNKDFFKSIGLPGVKPEGVFGRLCSAFNIEMDDDNTVRL
ncbi:hypothetical protein [Bacteroides sp. 51]|uniref:hypothetical protein n=1 Tax=Bacteroides sp. 51 TaxID=2302938 RepID=UPI0013D204CC|nr:hypothetical protein [Bacteroides sp. 51]NDV81552.1 hypothetical protein [Bacteroides sp. 51]